MPPDDELAAALRQGELTLLGRLVTASNATFLATVEVGGEAVRCVYKPERGERPLWDFPPTPLSRREVAAYVVSEAGGWGVVPTTVMRADGPFGGGMCQAWVEPADVDEEPEGEAPVGLVEGVGDDASHPGRLAVLEAEDERGHPVTLVHDASPALRGMAIFDVVANNSDRKGGHVLSDADGRLWGCDHGLCFHVEPKLRTVLWGWAGHELTDGDRAPLERLRGWLATDAAAADLGALLSDEERSELARRTEDLLAQGHMPVPSGEWPSIPWPPL